MALLRREEGLTFQEIAERLGISANQARRAYRAGYAQRGKVVEVSLDDLPLVTWWGAVLECPPRLVRHASCDQCGPEQWEECARLEREGQFLPCERVLDVELRKECDVCQRISKRGGTAAARRNDG